MYKVIANFICDGICKKIGEVLSDSDLDALESRIPLLVESKLIEKSKEEPSAIVEDYESIDTTNLVHIKLKEKSKKKSKG